MQWLINIINSMSPKKWCRMKMLEHNRIIKQSYTTLNEKLRDKGYEVIVEIKEELKKL